MKIKIKLPLIHQKSYNEWAEFAVLITLRGTREFPVLWVVKACFWWEIPVTKPMNESSVSVTKQIQITWALWVTWVSTTRTTYPTKLLNFLFSDMTHWPSTMTWQWLWIWFSVCGAWISYIGNSSPAMQFSRVGATRKQLVVATTPDFCESFVVLAVIAREITWDMLL